MGRQKILVVAALALAVVLAIAVGLFAFSPWQTGLAGLKEPIKKQTIKVGAVLPLTGDSAIAGQSIQQGIEIAAEEINNAGGVNGKRLVLIFEDDEFNGEKAVTAAQKLINADRIDIAITGFVSSAKPIAPIFEKAKVPLVVAWDSTQELEKMDYVFSTGFSTEAAGKRMASFAFKKLGLRKVAIVFHQDEWSEIIAPSFKKEFESLGGKVVLEEKVAVGESDFKTILGKIKQIQDIDGIYLPLVPPGADVFLKQAKELDVKAQIMSGDGLIPEIIAAAGEAAEGVYFTNIFAEDNDAAKSLAKKFKEKYGKEPEALPMVGFGYDAMLAIKRAAESAKEISPSGIKEALYSVDILSAGGRIKINQNGLTERVEKVFKVENGKAVPAE